MAFSAEKDDDLARLAAQAFGRLGGHARAKALSSDERKAIAKKAALARAKALSPRERTAIAKKAVKARMKKARKVKKQPE